jgi:hypothetical protein
MSKRDAIVPVRRSTLRAAARIGFDPYNSQPAQLAAWARYARMCGARTASEMSKANDVAG